MKPTYWQKYDRVFKHFSAKHVYREILNQAKKLGKPFRKKSKRGRKFKAKPEEYAAYIAYKITSLGRYRDMELESEIFLEKHIDHSTFGKNFFRIPYDYLLKLLELCAALLEQMLGKTAINIADSTEITTDRYKEMIYRGERRKKLVGYKLHSLITYYPREQVTIIKEGIASTKHISDSGGAVRMLDRCVLKGNFFADKGFFFEKVFRALKEKSLRAVIKPQNRKFKKAKMCKKAVKEFDSETYKQIRGIVETVFGGMENKGLLRTTLSSDELRYKYAILIQFRHNLQALLKLKASLNILLLVNCSTNSLLTVLLNP